MTVVYAGEEVTNPKSFSIEGVGSDVLLTLHELGKADTSWMMPEKYAPLAFFNGLKQVLHDRYGEPIYDPEKTDAS